MIVHYDRDRWIVRCDGRLGDDTQCPEAAEGPTEEMAKREAVRLKFVPLAGGRWACPAEHKRGVS